MSVSVLAAIAVIVYLVTAQPSKKIVETQQEQQVQTPSTVTESTPAATPEQQGIIINVAGTEYNFTPKSINLEAGKPVKIVYKNTGTLPHDLVITEFGVRTKVIGQGKEDAITFTPDKSGNFTFFCSVGNHRQLGMEGKITVE